MLTSCGGGSQSSAKGTSPQVMTQALTLNAGSTIPIVGGGQVSTAIEIHNNAPYAITGIKYSAQSNLVAKEPNGILQGVINQMKELFGVTIVNNQLINPLSAGLCSSIPANSSCSLQVTTPSLTTGSSASLLVNASYDNHGAAAHASQVYNLQYVPLNQDSSGIKCLSNVSLYPHGHPNGYGSLYCYIDGKPGDYYVFQNAATKSGVEITNLPPVGYQMSVGSLLVLNLAVGSVDIKNTNGVSATFLSDGAVVGLDLNYNSTSGEKFTTTATLNIYPSGSGAILVSGSVPLIANVLSSNQGIMTITNTGNTDINDLVITPGDNIVQSSATNCTNQLVQGASCTYGFIVNSVVTGNATISAGSISASTSTEQVVNWYAGGGPNLSSVVVPSSPSFKAGESAIYTVTLYNKGAESATYESTPSFVTIGTASGITPTIVQNVQCVDHNGISTGTVILPNLDGNCSYIVRLTNTKAETGFIRNELRGTYTDSSSGSLINTTTPTIVQWTSVGVVPQFILKVGPTATPSLNGDGESTITLDITIFNNGAAPGVIQDITQFGTGPFTLDTTGCGTIPGKTLSQGESCTYTMTFGPESNATINSISGIESSTVTYDGGTLINPMTVTTESINWIVTPDNENIIMSAYTNTYKGGTSVPSSGNGSSTDPFQLSGSMADDVMTLTYTNPGTSNLTIKGISDTVGGLYWLRNGLTTCINGYILQANSANSCQIVYDYQYNINSIYLGTIASPQSVNLSVPYLIFTNPVTGAQYKLQVAAPSPASGDKIYANATMATWTNTVTPNNTGTTAESFVMTSTIANATDYDFGLLSESIIVSIAPAFSSYVDSPSATVTCSYSTESGFIIQTCNGFSLAALTVSGLYTVGSNQTLYDKTNFQVTFVPTTGKQGFSIGQTNFQESF